MHTPFQNINVFNCPTLKAIDLNTTETLKYLIVVNETDYSPNKELLEAICKAFAFSENINGKYAVLNHQESINLANLYATSPFEMVLIFHVPTKRLGLNISGRKNKIIKTENFDIVYTDTLENLQTSKERKKSLWTCLSQYKTS